MRAAQDKAGAAIVAHHHLAGVKGGARIINGKGPDTVAAIALGPEISELGVCRENGHTIRGQAKKDLTLGTSHPPHIAKTFQMGSRRIGDDRRLGFDQIHGVGDLATVVGTELHHRVLVGMRQPQQRQGHANIVIEVTLGGQHLALLAEDRRHHLFICGFAGAAGHRHGRRRHCRHHQRPDLAQGLAAISHHQLWAG